MEKMFRIQKAKKVPVLSYCNPIRLHHGGSIEIIPVTGQLLPPDRHGSLRPAVGGGGQIVPVALIPEPPGFHIAGAVKVVPVVIDKCQTSFSAGNKLSAFESQIHLSHKLMVCT